MERFSWFSDILTWIRYQLFKITNFLTVKSLNTMEGIYYLEFPPSQLSKQNKKNLYFAIQINR